MSKTREKIPLEILAAKTNGVMNKMNWERESRRYLIERNGVFCLFWVQPEYPQTPTDNFIRFLRRHHKIEIPWLDKFIMRVFQNNKKAVEGVSKNLSEINDSDINKIGDSLAYYANKHLFKSNAAAVKSWLSDNPSMQLLAECDFFLPMVHNLIVAVKNILFVQITFYVLFVLISGSALMIFRVAWYGPQDSTTVTEETSGSRENW